jgi:hypothetical protein
VLPARVLKWSECCSLRHGTVRKRSQGLRSQLALKPILCVHRRLVVKVLITVVALAVLIVEPARAESAIAFVQSGRDYTAQPGASRDSGGSWQCYPYCGGGTYQRRPVREWMRPSRW